MANHIQVFICHYHNPEKIELGGVLVVLNDDTLSWLSLGQHLPKNMEYPIPVKVGHKRSMKYTL